MLRAVLFDLDGTVLASKKGIFRSAAYALNALGLPMPPENEMLNFLGPPLSDGFANVCHVPQENVADAVRLYREYYNNGGKFEADIYDGLPDLLKYLRSRDIRCYITTSKPHIFAKEILEHFSIIDLFDGVYGSELDGTRGHKVDVLRYCLEQHDLSVQDCILVGDRHFDVDGANLIGMRCIGVLYGYGSENELQKAGAYRLAENTEALEYILREL